jgi:transposase
MAPGSSPSLACRIHGISTGQLSTWRKQFRSGELTGFAPVSVVADGALPGPAAVPDVTDDVPAAVGLIEIELPTGVKLRINGDVGEAVLRRVLSALS